MEPDAEAGFDGEVCEREAEQIVSVNRGHSHGISVEQQTASLGPIDHGDRGILAELGELSQEVAVLVPDLSRAVVLVAYDPNGFGARSGPRTSLCGRASRLQTGLPRRPGAPPWTPKPWKHRTLLCRLHRGRQGVVRLGEGSGQGDARTSSPVRR